MFLNAILLDSAVQFLSAENVPAVFNIACCTNMLNDFSYEICRTRMPQCSGKNNCITQVITGKDDDKECFTCCCRAI